MNAILTLPKCVKLIANHILCCRDHSKSLANDEALVCVPALHD